MMSEHLLRTRKAPTQGTVSSSSLHIYPCHKTAGKQQKEQKDEGIERGQSLIE